MRVMLPETNLAVVQLFLLSNFSPDLTLSYNIMLKKGTARDDNIKTFEFFNIILERFNPAGNYIFNVNNKYTRMSWF